MLELKTIKSYDQGFKLFLTFSVENITKQTFEINTSSDPHSPCLNVNSNDQNSTHLFHVVSKPERRFGLSRPLRSGGFTRLRTQAGVTSTTTPLDPPTGDLLGKLGVILLLPLLVMLEDLDWQVTSTGL